MNKPQFLIAAANSGAGKTTVTLGLMRVLAKRNLSVQPFKCGPDYIDTKLHALASGKPSVNLDLFLASPEHIENTYNKYTSSVDVSVVEGVMGLFDGYKKMEGSAAHIAKQLDIPIVLVVNAKASAYSTAALLYGFKNFDKDIRVKGVIFNFVGSESHYSFLKDACYDVGVEPLGYLPKDENLAIPERHLGLDTDNTEAIHHSIDILSDAIEQHVDIERLLEITSSSVKSTRVKEIETKPMFQCIAVAKDEAFNFMYVENIETLQQLGSVVYFSPLHDKELPREADFVYLPGGYPEFYASKLSENKTMHQSIYDYIEKGGKLFAECGGMMYLSSSIQTNEGVKYPMVDIFHQEASMKNMKLKLGYRLFSYQGVEYRGHEFHYSQIISNLPSVAQQYGARGQEVDTKLLRYKNAVAGYTHIYWADNENWLNLFND